MMRKTILAAIAIMLIAAVTAQAAVFQYGSLVIAGDNENTYAYDAEKEEGKQTDKVCYDPPGDNSCAYGDRIYFESDGHQLIEYSPDSGNHKTLGYLCHGSDARVVFAGILDDKLYFTTVAGYFDVERTLKCLDLVTGEFSDVRANVYEACVWDGKLFVAMSLALKTAPDETLYYFGSLNEGFSSMQTYTKRAVCPEKPAGHIMWASPDALYYQEYAVDEATGETTGINLFKLWKRPEDGSIQKTCFGSTSSGTDAHVEYLGTDGEGLLFRIRFPGDESKNEVVLQKLSDDTAGFMRFTGKTGNQRDADVYVSDSGFYYMAEDCSLWRLETTAEMDRLIGRFPKDTILQGVTETDVYYVCGNSLYCSPLADLLTAAPEEHDDAQDSAALIGEIEAGLQKTMDACAPSPFVWPEILKGNPQIEPWLAEAAGKDLSALLSLDSGLEVSAETEGLDVRFRIRMGDESMDRQVTLPAGIAEIHSIAPRKWQLSDLLEGSRVDVEDGICDMGVVQTESGYEMKEVPCRIYHAVVGWQTVSQVLQDAMSALSGLFETFSIDASRLPDVSGQVASLEALAGDGVALDFYLADEGCIRIEAAVEKTPRVTGAGGGTPEIKTVSATGYTPGARWSIALYRDQNTIMPGVSDKSDIKTDIRITTTTEISNGSYPDRDFAHYSFWQNKNEMGYLDRFSFPLSGLSLGRSFGGLGRNSGSLQLQYLPESSTTVLSFTVSGDNLRDYRDFRVSFGAPEVSGSRILIPFTAEGTVSLSEGKQKTEGSLALEYR